MSAKTRIRVRSGDSIGVVINMAEHAPEFDDSLLIALDTMREMIEAGEITGLAIAGARFDGGVTTCYVLGDRSLTLMAAIRQVQRRVENEIPTD